MNTSVPIQYYVVSLIGGNIELHQKLWYQIDNIQSVNASTNMKSDVIVESPVHKEASKTSLSHNNKTHNMNIEYIDDGVRKVKEDTIIIPCVEEFNVRGRFFTLNKQAMVQGFRNEDFLFRVDLEVKAWCDIDILDMFLICVSLFGTLVILSALISNHFSDTGSQPYRKTIQQAATKIQHFLQNRPNDQGHQNTSCKQNHSAMGVGQSFAECRQGKSTLTTNPKH